MNTLTAPALSRTAPLSLRGTVTQVAMAIIVLAALSQVVIPLPFTPVPLSLGTLGAMLIGVALRPRLALTATSLYAVLGAAGMPILAGFQSGIFVASFGYVIGYILAATIVSVWTSTEHSASRIATVLVVVAATASIYAAGTLWMIVAFNMSLGAALNLGVLPFLAGDALKGAVVAGTVLLVGQRTKSW